MSVSLRPVEDGDLDTIYEQTTDPESVWMAAFTAEDPTDRAAFLARMARIRADTSACNRVIDVDGVIITVFDPINHRPIDGERIPDSDGYRSPILNDTEDFDQRWVRCRRP